MRFEVGNLQLFGLDIGSLAQRWKAGLQDIIPNGLVGCFVRPAPTIEAVIDKDSIRFVPKHPAKSTEVVVLQHNEIALATDGVLKKHLVNGLKVSQLQLNLVMPEEQVMRRRVMLPRVARNNLRNVMSYQIGRLTPFSADKLFFDVIEIPASASSGELIEVEFIAVLKVDAQPWINQIERLTGLKVSRLTALSTDGLIAADINLFNKLRTRNAWWLRLNRNSALLMMLIVALLVTAIVPVAKLRSLVVDRKHEIQIVDERITGLQEKRQILEHDLTSLNYVLEQRAKNKELSVVIEELTRIVPDEIYISNLSVQNQKIVMSGTGTGVVDLIELLNSSTLFEDAKFTASITRGRAGEDIFTASVQLITAVDDKL